MTLKAIRVNETRPRLTRMLMGFLHAEFWKQVDADYGGDPRDWPPDAIEGILLAYQEWRQTVGRVEIVARTHACIGYEGVIYCVLQVTYERVKEQQDVPLARVKQQQELPQAARPLPSAEADGRVESPKVSPAVRQISPSLCGDDFIAAQLAKLSG